MKKAILIFSLFLFGTSFANANPEMNNVEKAKKSIVSLNDKDDEFGCTVSCYATVTNTETGKSVTFYGTASADLCGAAIISCQTYVLGQAYAYINKQ